MASAFLAAVYSDNMVTSGKMVVSRLNSFLANLCTYAKSQEGLDPARVVPAALATVAGNFTTTGKMDGDLAAGPPWRTGYTTGKSLMNVVSIASTATSATSPGRTARASPTWATPGTSVWTTSALDFGKIAKSQGCISHCYKINDGVRASVGRLAADTHLEGGFGGGPRAGNRRRPSGGRRAWQSACGRWSVS
uniref:Uncharacterized protein n=1 Tax=Oryza punctata TaxID=4537 RepID=A0A0E0LSN4_ORYPU